jgi:hypothetical protein
MRIRLPIPCLRSVPQLHFSEYGSCHRPIRINKVAAAFERRLARRNRYAHGDCRKANYCGDASSPLKLAVAARSSLLRVSASNIIGPEHAVQAHVKICTRTSLPCGSGLS